MEKRKFHLPLSSPERKLRQELDRLLNIGELGKARELLNQNNLRKAPSSTISISPPGSPEPRFHRRNSIPSPAPAPPPLEDKDILDHPLRYGRFPRHSDNDVPCKNKPWEERKRTVMKYRKERDNTRDGSREGSWRDGFMDGANYGAKPNLDRGKSFGTWLQNATGPPTPQAQAPWYQEAEHHPHSSAQSPRPPPPPPYSPMRPAENPNLWAWDDNYQDIKRPCQHYAPPLYQFPEPQCPEAFGEDANIIYNAVQPGGFPYTSRISRSSTTDRFPSGAPGTSPDTYRDKKAQEDRYLDGYKRRGNRDRTSSKDRGSDTRRHPRGDGKHDSSTAPHGQPPRTKSLLRNRSTKSTDGSSRHRHRSRNDVKQARHERPDRARSPSRGGSHKMSAKERDQNVRGPDLKKLNKGAEQQKKKDSGFAERFVKYAALT
ncbi:hypothetical protein V8F20_010529 [Naviculisporaceae sp. PSN 640]